MLKLLPLLLLGGCATVVTPEKYCADLYGQDSKSLPGCIRRMHEAGVGRTPAPATQTQQVVYVPAPAQPYQIPTNAMKAPEPMQAPQMKRTECRNALGGGFNCTTY